MAAGAESAGATDGAAMELETTRLAPPGNRIATISAGDSSEVSPEVCTGSALKAATRPAKLPTPTTAAHTNSRLLAR